MIVNNSVGNPYFTQRNNRFLPAVACNVTAAIDAIAAANWPLPRVQGEQPEDTLMSFLHTNEKCLAKWRSVDVVGRIPPQEWHIVLQTAINEWTGIPDLDTMVESVSALDLLAWILEGGTGLVSGMFPKTNGHFVAVVGAHYSESPMQISAFILDDPWGDYRKGYRIHNGDNVEMALQDWIDIVKPAGQNLKRVHFIRPNR